MQVNALFKALASISSLLLGYIFLFSGNSLLTTLVSLRAQLQEFSTLNIGIIHAAYFLGLFLGAKYCDWLVARSGHSRAYAVFASVGAVCALLHSLIVNEVAWVIIRLGTGICIAGLMMVTESWLNSKATRNTRGQILSIYMITHFLASGSGQLLIPIAKPDTFHLFSIAAIGYCLALLPVLITRHSAPMLQKREKVRFAQIFRFSRIGMTGALCCGLIASALYGLTPVYTQAIGMSITTTALFMALVIFSGGLLQWPIGKISDRLDRRKLMAIMCLISGIFSIAVILSSALPRGFLLASAALFSAAAFTVYPIALAHINDSTPKEKLIYASAGMLVSFSIGAVIGPIIAGSAIELFGYNALFVYFSFIFLLYGLLVLWRIRTRKPPERKKFRRFFRGANGSEYSHPKNRDETDKDNVQSNQS